MGEASGRAVVAWFVVVCFYTALFRCRTLRSAVGSREACRRWGRTPARLEPALRTGRRRPDCGTERTTMGKRWFPSDFRGLRNGRGARWRRTRSRCPLTTVAEFGGSVVKTGLFRCRTLRSAVGSREACRRGGERRRDSSPHCGRWRRRRDCGTERTTMGKRWFSSDFRGLRNGRGPSAAADPELVHAGEGLGVLFFEGEPVVEVELVQVAGEGCGVPLGDLGHGVLEA